MEKTADLADMMEDNNTKRAILVVKRVSLSLLSSLSSLLSLPSPLSPLSSPLWGWRFNDATGLPGGDSRFFLA